MKGLKGADNLILVEDWNTVVGEGRERNIVGKYGLGERNKHGDRLVEFGAKPKLAIANILFENYERRRYKDKKI